MCRAETKFIFMKKFILVAILSCLFFSICSAQKRRTPAGTIKSQPTETLAVAEISDAEWKILTAALQAEEWTKAAALAAQYLKRLTTDNDKKQLAQLRYFYLYGLAGEILAFSDAKLSIEEEAAWTELNEAVGNFTNKEFILPPHQFSSDCKKSVNYICAARDNDHALRITETNRSGTAIYSFDYILFDEKIVPGESSANKIFLGGNLRRAEFNQDLSKRWVMRLIFEKGFVNLVPADN